MLFTVHSYSQHRLFIVHQSTQLQSEWHIQHKRSMKNEIFQNPVDLSVSVLLSFISRSFSTSKILNFELPLANGKRENTSTNMSTFIYILYILFMYFLLFKKTPFICIDMYCNACITLLPACGTAWDCDQRVGPSTWPCWTASTRPWPINPAVPDPPAEPLCPPADQHFCFTWYHQQTHRGWTQSPHLSLRY